MAAKDRVLIELYVDDQGTVKIQNARAAVQELGPAGEGSGKQLGSGLDYAADRAGNLATQLLAVAGISVSVAGAAYLMEKAFSSWYGLVSGGISIVDDYQKKIIGTSYIMATMSQVPAPDLSQAYAQWTAFHKWLYSESIYVDKQSAASSGEIFALALELEKKGIVANTREKMETVGRFTDLMKGVIPTYASLEQQARGEIEAVLNGITRIGAQTAQVLASIDPEFKKNIASARENNTVLEYFESILPKINQYTKDLMGTWDAVGASLKSAWSIINVQAFGDAHKEVVQFATELGNRLVDNGRLTEQGERAVQALGGAWRSAKESAAEAMDYVLNNSDELISKISTVLIALGRIAGLAINIGIGFLGVIDSISQFAMNVQVAMVYVRANIGYVIEWFEILGRTAKDVAHGIIWDFGEIGPAIDRAYASMEASSNRWSRIAIQDANDVRGAVLNSMVAGKTPVGFSFMEGLTPGTSLPVAPGRPTPAPPTPPVNPYAGKEPKGGGGKGRDTTDTLENLIMQLRQEQAKLAEGAFAGVEAAYAKTVAKITKLAMDQQQLDDGLLAAKEWKAAKEQKISDDFNKWYLGQMHQTTALQVSEDDKKLASVKGHVDEEDKTRAVIQQHAQERADKLALAENQQQKTYYDALASSSILIADQIAWKEQSWLLEKKISEEQLKQWFVGKDLTDSQKDNYRGLLALTNQAKEYNQARQKAVDLGTLEGWAIERAGEALKKDKTTIKDLMEGGEKYLTDAFSTGITGVLSRDKQKLTDIWKTIFQSALLGINQKSITTVFSSIAKLKAGDTESTTGAGGADASGKALSVAAKDLQKGGMGLNSAGLQLGLSAGGLLLSGIGIATNSQFLVIAGTVLQVTGMAISLYEALTSTLTVASMTVAATTLSVAGMTVGVGGGSLIAAGGALTAAATALMTAAIVDASTSWLPFHTGGLVAHEGLLVAHNGLLPDERLVKVLTGEPILQRSAMAAYTDMGISFDDLNNARLPVRAVPVPVRGGGGSVNNDNKQVHFNFHKGAIQIPIQDNGMTPQKAELIVQRFILPALQKKAGNKGLNFLE